MSHSEDAGQEAPFDLDRLRELVELMEKHGLTEINLRRGDERWQLRRGGGEVALQPIAPTASFAAPTTPPPLPAATGGAESSPASSPAEAEESGLIDIKSPTVGTFYAAPSPEDPPFVTVGSKVEPETVVCLVEAMKVFNQIPAEVSGTIVKILVNNGDPVEFGQPLFKVRPG